MTTASLAAQAAALTATMAQQAPAALLAPFEAEQADLNAAGVPADAAQPGTTVPDVALLDADGAPTSLHAVTGDRPSVVVTFRGAWGPYCNLALRTYQDQLVPELDARGITLVAVSPQKPEGSAAVQDKNSLTFPVVSDPGNKLASSLGFPTTPSADAVASLMKLGVHVEALNADGTTALPMPTVLVVDGDHTLRWIDVHPDYTTRTEVADIVAALDTLK